MNQYGFHVGVECPFEEAIERVIEALASEGFGVLSDIDVQAAFAAKLGVTRPPYRILGACNPALAKQALDHDPDIGLLLPCNVVVREDAGGAITVALVDPEAMLSVVGDERVAELAAEVRERLLRVRDVLAG